MKTGGTDEKAPVLGLDGANEQAVARVVELYRGSAIDGRVAAAELGLGAVYFKELDAYVTERVKDLSEGKQHPLTSPATTISNIPLTRP